MIRFTQQYAAVGIFKLGSSIGEMAADVAQARRAEQGVGKRVQQRVGIGMAEQAFFKRDVYAAEYQIAAFDELVDIVALSDADVHLVFLIDEAV